MKIPSIYELKPAFQNLLRPIARFLVKIHISANQVTVSAVILSIITGAVIYFFQENNFIFFILPAVFFIRMGLNAIDGMLAREFNMKSNLGAVLNELGDVISDTALFLPFAFIFSDGSAHLVILFIILAILSEMTGVIAVQIGASRRYDGPMGKSDRVFVVGTLAFFMGFGIRSFPWFSALVFYLFLFLIVLLIFTIFNRIKSSLKEAGA
ncbi:MAG: CDP-alcohol phosphatidyltransferase family protein [Spirochaetia bacterium]|nr:CDP-alcohol phosphatidyltransferase family protein [Spirochaetia bacterium]